MTEAPEFGPRGYLPERAARRARKIVLRGQMSLGWVVAALAAAVLVAAVGLVWLVRSGPPGPPFVATADVAEVAAGGLGVADAGGTAVLIVRVTGGLRVFVAPPTPVTYCAASRRLEGADGTVWRVDGQRVGGPGASLAPVPVTVHDGTIYASPDDAAPALAPGGGDEPPVCRGT